MKVNLQKIIVLISVLNICLSLFGISTFAYTGVTDYVYTSEKEAFLDAVNLINAYSNGEISFADFSSDLIYVQGKSVTAGLDVAAVKIKQFYDICNLKFGSDSSFGGSEHGGGGTGGSRTPITDLWNDICNKNDVPTEETQTSSTDLMGGGALIRRYYDDGTLFEVWSCDYVVIDNNSGRFNIYGEKVDYFRYGTTGNLEYTQTSYPNGLYLSSEIKSYYKFYGDVRYKDGTQAPTDDEYIYGSIYNYEGLTDKQLKDLIEQLADEIQQEYPDLSSIEGLLNAIYARLGSLDSDNDNQLLSEILTAIKAIKSTDTDNTELLELLEEIKNSLVFNDGENTETFSEQLKIIIDNQITRDDFVIDEDLYNNHGEILKERLLGKFSFIYNMKTFVTYCFDKYSNTSESPKFDIEYNNKSYSINFNAFNEYMPTIQWIIAAFIYLTYAYHTYRKIPSYINGGDNE